VRFSDRLLSFYQDSVRECQESILDRLPSAESLLDYGCSDGALTARFAERAGATRVFGVEVVDELAQKATQGGVQVVAVKDGRLELPDASLDVFTANQLIEHLADTDTFVQEAFRVLRPGGTFLVCTNNLASWHNIVALLAGAQPFPADVSIDSGIGKLVRPFGVGMSSMAHLRVFSYRALIEIMEAYGFDVADVRGVSYYPLPSKIASRVAARFPRHATYLTVQSVKPR
jgi:SAM-dependent methyltransferase